MPFVFFTVTGIGIYFPYKGANLLGPPETIAYLIIAIPLASEFLFRGLVHGILINPNNAPSYDRRRLFSFPSVASGSLYAVCMAGILLYPGYLQSGFQVKATAGCLLAALVLGLSTALVRERSQSVLPAILFHALGMAAVASYYSGTIVSKIGAFISIPVGY